MTLLTLCMMVKDEAKTIERTLRSALPYVDGVCILDTGSTDGTQGIAARTIGNGISGAVHERSFVDFATTRNVALDLAELQDSKYILVLDADDVLEDGAALRSFLESCEADCVNLRMESRGYSWDSPRIVRNGSGWRYKGVVHEVLVKEGVQPSNVRAPATVRHIPSGDSPERSRKRWERDYELLLAEVGKNSECTRSWFYLAMTSHWLQRYELAEQYFRKRIALGGWREEVFESKLRLGHVALGLELPWPEVQARYLDAYEFAPHRAEPLFCIAIHHHHAGNRVLTYLFAERGHRLPFPTGDKLFVDQAVYDWKLADLVATHAQAVGEFEVGRLAALKALAHDPSNKRLQRNLETYDVV